jgi:uncharacterized membrane protein
MDLFREHKPLLKYLVATIIFYMMIAIPFFIITAAGTFSDRGTTETIIFVIAFMISLVAAAYLFLKYQFYGYFIVDRGSGPIDALQQSGRMTKGVLKNLLIFWLEMVLGIAFALFTVSIFIEIPVGLILQLISEDLSPLAKISSILSSGCL